MKKVFFDNSYTVFIKAEDKDFFYGILELFHSYNQGEIKDNTEEKEIIEYILKEFEFIRSLPSQIENEDIEDFTEEEIYENVKNMLLFIIKNEFSHGEEILKENLSARIALGLGLRYEDEITKEDNLIEIKEKGEELEFSNFYLSEDSED